MHKFETDAPPYVPLDSTSYQPTTSNSNQPTEIVSRVTTMETNPTFVTHLPPVGPRSQRMVCYNCKCQISTTVETKANMGTHSMCCALSPLSILCCCCIPYCFDSCKSQHHYCPNCNVYLGTFRN